MGAFNTVTAEVACPVCGAIGLFEVQFKYGDTWQFEYALGDVIRWGGNDKGEPGRSCVLVEGCGGPCPNCHVEYMDFDVVVERDRLTGVRPVGLERDNESPEGYRVIQD